MWKKISFKSSLKFYDTFLNKSDKMLLKNCYASLLRSFINFHEYYVRNRYKKGINFIKHRQWNLVAFVSFVSEGEQNKQTKARQGKQSERKSLKHSQILIIS